MNIPDDVLSNICRYLSARELASSILIVDKRTNEIIMSRSDSWNPLLKIESDKQFPDFTKYIWLQNLYISYKDPRHCLRNISNRHFQAIYLYSQFRDDHIYDIHCNILIIEKCSLILNPHGVKVLKIKDAKDEYLVEKCITTLEELHVNNMTDNLRGILSNLHIHSYSQV